MTDKKVVIFSDGGSRNNPGPAAGGAVVFFDETADCQALGKYYGTQTNNQAEYRALIDALAVVEARYPEKIRSEVDLEIFLDSELIVRQLNGEYQVKNEGLKDFYDQLQEKLSQYGNRSITHILRANNKLADKILNVVLDRYGK
jgi:ribonuclease HI